jgi:hypothetical protein
LATTLAKSVRSSTRLDSNTDRNELETVAIKPRWLACEGVTRQRDDTWVYFYLNDN